MYKIVKEDEGKWRVYDYWRPVGDGKRQVDDEWMTSGWHDVNIDLNTSVKPSKYVISG